MNNFYHLMDLLEWKEFSDVHISEDKKVAIRNSKWEIEYIDFILDKDDIFWFANDMLWPWQIDEFLEWAEKDIAYTHKNSRYRINLYYDMLWVNMSMRKISAKPLWLEEIWLPSSLNKIYLKDRWLILVTWPTGSGKSTTLSAIINYINENKKCHIITLEDPIEYVFDSKKAYITQREIWKNTKNWKTGIKYILRQDPDVIMIWEMRDLETISATLTLVETGHLVLATLHTINAIQTISRIIDVFPPNQQAQIAVQLSMTIELIISQRLLPVKNWNGRVAVREIMLQNPAIANLIRERKLPQIYSVMETQISRWMMTMDHSLAKLVAEWKIEPSLALSKVKNPSIFKELVNYYLHLSNKNKKWI